MMRIIVTLVMLVALSGCTPNVDVTKTSKGFQSQTDPNNVDILMTKPERKFTELGAVSTSGWKPAETAKMHNALRAKAAPLGADAVIVLNSGLVPTDWGMRMWITAVAIKYAN